VVIVADGLMAFLSKDHMVSLLNRLISHFPSGEIAFNSYTKFAIWASKHVPSTSSQLSWNFPASTTPGNLKAGTRN
jgi:O-methyltransferase involved in polyketide biosynthesis